MHRTVVVFSLWATIIASQINVAHGTCACGVDRRRLAYDYNITGGGPAVFVYAGSSSGSGFCGTSDRVVVRPSFIANAPPGTDFSVPTERFAANGGGDCNSYCGTSNSCFDCCACCCTSSGANYTNVILACPPQTTATLTEPSTTTTTTTSNPGD